MALDKIYDTFIKQHRLFENKNLRLLLKEFRKQFRDILFDNLTFSNAESVILLNFDQESLRKTLYKIHYTTGMQYGRMVARQLRVDNPDKPKKYKPLPLFSEAFQRFLLDYYETRGGELITLISGTVASEIVKEIIAGTDENESVEQMRDRIYKTVNSPDFYKWQALRISRTETGFAMNSASYAAGSVSGVLMEKVWIGRDDGRERSSHIAMNGTKVGVDEYFHLGRGVQLRFPCDRDGKGSPRGIAKEVIQCRCSFGFVAKRDAEGRLIFTD